MIKKLLGIAPKPDGENSFSPSPVALALATSDVADYRKVSFGASQHAGKPKILMLCSERSAVPMTNGTFFSSGNHPVETLVPMLHLRDVGFDFDIYTPTGDPVKFEMWAMPRRDRHVMGIYNEYKAQFDKPRSLATLAASEFKGIDDHIAMYIPGGHGALLGLPEDRNVGTLIKWFYKKDKYHLAICHGPAALLAAKPAKNETFIYDGYKIAAFPDRVDRQTPLIGYMPGQLTWFFGEKLQELGISITNSRADKTCHVDRKLITGASPRAANEFGKLAAETLVRSLG